MLMREWSAALGHTPREQAAADEFVPGWRDMTPAEFNEKAAPVIEKLRREKLRREAAEKQGE
jgi:hypothetical protein